MRPARNPNRSADPRLVMTLLLLLHSGPVIVEARAGLDEAVAWKFQPGQVLRYRIRQAITTKVVTGASSEPFETPTPSLDATLCWVVEEVDAHGSAKIRQTLEHVREEMTERSPDGARMVYDSGDPKSVGNPWSAMKDALYRPLLGSSYRLSIDRLGRITDIVMPRDVLKGWQKFSLQPHDDRDYLFTKEGMKSLLSAVPELPGRLIARGEIWRHRREINDGVTRTTSIDTFSLTGLERSSASFDAKPEIIVEVAPNPARNGAEPIPSKEAPTLVGAGVEKQSGEGKLTFDLATSRLVTFSRRHRYEVKYAYRAEVRTGQAQTIKVTTAIVIDMELVAASDGR